MICLHLSDTWHLLLVIAHIVAHIACTILSSLSPAVTSPCPSGLKVAYCHHVNVTLFLWVLVPFFEWSPPGWLHGFCSHSWNVCASNKSCATWIWPYSRTDPNVMEFKNVIQLLCLVPVQVWSSLLLQSLPLLILSLPQICNLCFCMCSILSKHSSFLQWCYWTLQYCSTLLVRIVIPIALGVISSPFYRWRNRGTENFEWLVQGLPVSKLVSSVICCLMSGSPQCSVCLYELCIWLSSLQPWKCFPCRLPTHCESLILNPTCWLNSSG